MKTYEYQHTIGFEETNLVGNVYYVNHLKWQGRCREMFLKDCAPEILQGLSEGLALATVQVSCEYFVELFAFDTVAIRMRLKNLTQNRVTMGFEYWKLTNGNEELIARGEQQIACMKREGEQMIPIAVPSALRAALQPYVEGVLT